LRPEGRRAFAGRRAGGCGAGYRIASASPVARLPPPSPPRTALRVGLPPSTGARAFALAGSPPREGRGDAPLCAGGFPRPLKRATTARDSARRVRRALP
ncbi:MAG: hypothetical protein FWF84_05915, partial [Kiritimatiellaeota bacterium]|nr:hypothetical protein [Kiritimatiellota bacterium]